MYNIVYCLTLFTDIVNYLMNVTQRYDGIGSTRHLADTAGATS